MQVLIENQILPPVSVLCKIVKADSLLIEMQDSYQKRTYRNRFIILTPKGRHVLSIPLVRGKNSLKYTDVQISYDNLWLTTLGSTLKSNYGSSPFFYHYFHLIMDIFLKRHKFLFDLNNELRSFIFDCLGIEVPVMFTSRYIRSYDKEVSDLRNIYLPTKTAPNSSVFKHYSQVYEDQTGFIADASIIDLLFNAGKFSIEYL